MASCINIPLCMVVAFLLLTLGVGIYFSSKVTSFQQYAIGDKRFATATLVATVLATAYGGGGLVRNVQQVHNLGLYWIILSLLIIFDLYIVSHLALRMGQFMNHFSMPETIGSVYGKYARMITALSGICDAIAMIAGQISAMSLAISMCLDSVNPKIITILVTIILIFYSSFGGIRAVTFTDVLQFITFTIIILILAWFMLKSSGKSLAEMIPFLQDHPKFQLSQILCFDKKLVGTLLLVLSFLVGYIEPPTIQRVYMSSSPIQAGKVFLYATFFSCVITIFIILIGLFVFVGAPDLPVTAIWGYIMDNVPPIFKGMVCISLLAMAMSTADSKLNACAVMISHDMLHSIRSAKNKPYRYQLRLATCTSLIIGLFSMILTLYCDDLLSLIKLSLDFSLPIATAPFVLAVFGFRGTSRTALIGICTGVVSILVWNKWIEPQTDINGSFICMLANGLAMMLAHYFLKQPSTSGWAKTNPDDPFTQMQEINRRKKAARREAIKNGFIHLKNTLAKLQPSHTTLTWVGLYVVITNLLIYFVASITNHACWLIPQLIIGACFLGYSPFYSKNLQTIPNWAVGLFWVTALAFCLPINVLWHWWHGTALFLTLGLSLAHLAVTLSILPLYLGVTFVIVTLLMAIAFSSIYYTTALILILPSATVAWILLLCLVLGLLIFGIFIGLKGKLYTYFEQIRYLKDIENMRISKQLKATLYDAAMMPDTGLNELKGHGSILAKVVHKMEESISFLDSNMPLYRQDFQSIINKLYDWVNYFNKKEKAKGHVLLQPTTIGLNKLIRKVEFALTQEIADPPKLLIEKVSNFEGVLSSHITCDIHQVVYSLVKVILRVGSTSDSPSLSMVKIQLHNTFLQFKQADPIGNGFMPVIRFEAIGLVVSNAACASNILPKVKPLYDDKLEFFDFQNDQATHPSIDLELDTISSMVRAHYGYFEYHAHAQEKFMLVVLPVNVIEIRDKMTINVPLDCLNSQSPITPKEQADSMMVLMQFHDYASTTAHYMHSIDINTISNILLLLRQSFGFKRHASGQLFYVRAVNIAQSIVEWVFHSPKVVYAALLYELVRHTCVPLSYIKECYNLGVYGFVLNVLSVDKRQDLDHFSLLYVRNRLKEAIKEDHLQLSVLFIKLAERLHDLSNAQGYSILDEVKHMANETLAIDVPLANEYLNSDIADALATAAKKALKVYHRKKLNTIR